ncbi:DUF2011 domain-containing protein [Luminiphilus sp.]|nr:DUF2011 domain-containing protein [Luminiphilus sp.]
MRIFLACLTTFSALSVSAEPVSIQCGASEGWSYYFAGGLVSDEKSGFSKDAITGGKTTLVVDDDGNGDVLFVDSTGSLGSAKQQGGEVIVLNANDTAGMNWLLMYPGGVIENYALNLSTMKVAAWRNTVGNLAVAKNSLLVADCTFK